WVREPTRESADVGFAVNANFDLDAGRARVHATEHNTKIAQALGERLGQALVALFDASEGAPGWTAFARSVAPAGEIDPYDFWHSVWRRLAVSLRDRAEPAGSPALPLIRAALWCATAHGLPH